MLRPKKICGKCKRIKGRSCICPEKKPFEGISKDNYSVYNSSRWRRYSKGLRKNHPLCEHCLKKGVTSPSEVVDHIHPISKGGDVWDRDNLQMLCHKCHNTKTGKSK